MCKFSIIVPCYNLAPWIRACVDSVLAQSYVDWECIVVDDESKDESGKILDEYAARDARIRVVHQQNKGEGGSRNTGIAAARGEWVFFLDGDDVMAPGALEKLAGLMEAYPQEKLIRFGYENFEDGTEWKPKAVEKSVVQKDISKEISMDDFYTFVWQHLYRREIIEGIRFKRYIRGCDRVFVDEVLLNRVDSFIEMNEIVYGYRQRATSAVHMVPSAQVIADEMDHRCDIMRMVEQANKSVCLRRNYYMSAGYFVFWVGVLIFGSIKEEQQNLIDAWYRNADEIRRFSNIGLRSKIVLDMCCRVRCDGFLKFMIALWPSFLRRIIPLSVLNKIL